MARTGPVHALRRRWFALKERVFLLRHRDRAERFAAIFAGNVWQNPESRSGFGSTRQATAPLRAGLDRLIADYAVRSITDAPCGDFNWQGLLHFDGAYTGVDIVAAAVSANAARHGTAGRRFVQGDIVRDPVPPADLVLSRDCLNHLPLSDGLAALQRLAAAAGRLLAVTHYPGAANADQAASFRYRALDLTAPPFDLRQPDRLLADDEPGKTVAVWDLALGSPFRAT